MSRPTYILLLAPLLITVAGLNQRKLWDYSILSLTLNSSNEKLFKPRLVLERISRGNFAMSGTLELKYDSTKDTSLELSVYRSTTGTTSTYKKLPYSFPKQSFLEYMNSFYKDMLMKGFKNCSNMPQFAGKVQVIEQKTYEFKQCKFANEKLPAHVDAGFYKFVACMVYAPGSMKAIFEMLVQIESTIV